MGKWGKQSDVVMAAGVLGLILLLVIPLPPLLLDALLSVSIVLSVMTLLLTLYIEKGLEFSAFPSLLLFLTLFRLGLNIASTRMILSRGEGGDIIGTFGEFVTGGNLVVGLILFVLLTLINFIVVTKGAGRVAEVAARFTLEALPGKQMAIDADVAAGMMSQAEARAERKKIGEEAEFYGAMDGASKFVRGDAIAGLVITGVNLVGGFLVGLTVRELGWMACLETFTRLTVGDGLVSQLPALLISVAAGILVTRASAGSVGRSLPGQMVSNPKVVLIAAGCLGLLSFVPGMPTGVMVTIAAAVGFFGYTKLKGKPQREVEVKEEVLEGVLVAPLEVALGYRLIGWAERLMQRVPGLRRRVATQIGVVIPAVKVRDELTLGANEFVIRVKGVTVHSARAEDEEAVMSALERSVVAHAHELLNRQDVARMVENAKAYDSAVVEELIPGKLNLGQILKVLQNLLKEGVPIRDFVSILEVLADHVLSDERPEIDALTEAARQGLAAGISERLFGARKVARVITMDPKVEQIVAVAKGIRPVTAEKISEAVERLVGGHERVVVLTSAHSRPALRRLLEKKLPHTPILSYQEVGADISIETLGTVPKDVLL